MALNWLKWHEMSCSNGTLSPHFHVANPVTLGYYSGMRIACHITGCADRIESDDILLSCVVVET